MLSNKYSLFLVVSVIICSKFLLHKYTFKGFCKHNIMKPVPLGGTSEHAFIQQLLGCRHCVGTLHSSLIKPSHKIGVGCILGRRFLWTSAEASLSHQRAVKSRYSGFWDLQYPLWDHSNSLGIQQAQILTNLSWPSHHMTASDEGRDMWARTTCHLWF